MTDVAAAHADDRGSTPKEMETMHELARLSEDELGRIIGEFLDEVFGGLDIDPGFEARMRSDMPDLPDEPTHEQVEAWIELGAPTDLKPEEDAQTLDLGPLDGGPGWRPLVPGTRPVSATPGT